jgi:hypothetical protein
VLRHFNKIPQPITTTVSPKSDTTIVVIPPQEQRAAM